MSPSFANALASAEQLDESERRELIDVLTLGLKDRDTGERTPTLPPEWQRIVAERWAAYDAGEVETVSWDELKAEWRARRGGHG